MSDIENHASLRSRSRSSPDKPSSRSSGHENLRMRKQDGERRTFHDRNSRDDYKGGSFSGRGKYDSYNRHHSRDYDRRSDRARDGETKDKYGGGHSKRSRRGSRSRSRSRSPSRSESKRTSGFDMAPPATDVTPAVSGIVGLDVLPTYLSAYTL